MLAKEGDPKRNRLLEGYTGIWPRESLETPELLGEIKQNLGRPGVYVLYRDDVPYYVGQARGRLWKRLRSHALRSVGQQYYFWNFFSAFVVPEAHIDEAEAMLIAALPTAVNRAKPKITRIILSREARNALKKIRLRRAGLSERQLPRAVKSGEDIDEDGEDDTEGEI
ncbi:MAG TPA: GIY-YIG nuclease family protein [Terriglobia bacterium]|jgi:hypothetical protein|nr:GIY-YIG nuclease family protein [Terriglobia bacterium]